MYCQLRTSDRKKISTIFKRTLAKLSSLLLKFFDGSLIDTTTLVDQVSSSGGFTGVDMTND
jgi:hypothetical protein